jgi:hypothetical protein
MRDHLETLMMNFKTKKKTKDMKEKKELKREEDEEVVVAAEKKITLLSKRENYFAQTSLGISKAL